MGRNGRYVLGVSVFWALGMLSGVTAEREPSSNVCRGHFILLIRSSDINI